MMNHSIQPHTNRQTLVLHLLPGVLNTTIFYLSAQPLIQKGYPALLVLYLAILFVLIPLQLGYLLYQGKKHTGRLSLKGVVLYRERLPLWQYFVFVPLLLGWSAAAFLTLAPLDEFLIRNFFQWLPAWAIPANGLVNTAQYPPSMLILTYGLGLALNGIAGPVVEELYFRGYLLPRIPASRLWAPLINVLLFSLYHFFSPWQNITRIIALLPLVYIVAWKRNIYISIFTHCLMNSLGILAAVAQLIT